MRSTSSRRTASHDGQLMFAHENCFNSVRLTNNEIVDDVDAGGAEEKCSRLQLLAFKDLCGFVHDGPALRHNLRNSCQS
jgi:hypothetical protein